MATDYDTFNTTQDFHTCISHITDAKLTVWCFEANQTYPYHVAIYALLDVAVSFWGEYNTQC
jgi:hypothetical protein